MKEQEIITEIERYLSDTSYNYAVMIDGEWGCGKTYFVKNSVFTSIADHGAGSDHLRTPKYISLYGIKTVSDIQDAIVFALAEEIKIRKDTPKREDKTGREKKILFSTWRIAKAFRDIKAPDTNLYELIGNWFDLKSFVFIFDDIERCDCPLNEVFGFINGLVEHEGVKVVLVANEDEIHIKEVVDRKELQYLVTANEQIEYPKVRDFWGNEDKKTALTIEELERRRKILFPSNLVDEEFKKIREKLIGVTLHFQPDVKSICSDLIQNSTFTDEVKEKLNNHVDSFYSTMRNAKHLNLRTFQFFISKLKNVVDSLDTLTIPTEYRETIEQKIISDCFSSSIYFKANIQPPEDRIERISFDLSREKRSKAIEIYVGTGELQLEKLQNEIDQYINDNLLDLIPPDDPYKLLQQEYYLHPQKWCEERIKAIIEKINNNSYPTIAYGEVIRPLLILEDMGFDHCYLDSVKKQMIANVSITDKPKAPNNQLYFFEDNPSMFTRGKQVMSEIENAIAIKNNEEKGLSLDEILKQEDWVDKLTQFVEQHNLKDDPNGTVFSTVNSGIWTKLIKEATPETITKFRHWLHWVYPTNLIHQNRQSDIVVLETISKEIDPDEVDDLIVKSLLNWLKKDIEKICSFYDRNVQGGASLEAN